MSVYMRMLVQSDQQRSPSAH